MKLLRFRVARDWIVIAALALFASGAADAAEPYRIGPGDALAIDVYGDPGLSGVFSVEIDGTISHPLLGSVTVADKTARDIRTDLIAGLATYVPNPAVAVHVETYAPVYVLGEVEKPGAYAFRPGMTAIQLIALAGGNRRALAADGDSGLLRAISLESERAELALWRYAREVTIARLEAELNQTAFEFHEAVPPLVSPADARRAVEAERRLFDMRGEALRSAEAGLSAQIDGYAHEIDSLREGIRLYDEELALVSEDVEATRVLVERNVSTPIRLREVLRTQSATRRDSLEVRASLAQAQQGKLDTERRRQELRGAFRTTAATELREGELQLAADRMRLRALAGTLSALDGDQAAPLASPATPTFVILRASGTSTEELPAAEGAVLRPGDILRVALPSAAPAPLPADG